MKRVFSVVIFVSLATSMLILAFNVQPVAHAGPTYIPKLYGIIGNTTRAHLVTIDESTGHATEVGIINATGVHGLAYDRNIDTLYSMANCTAHPELIVLNRTTAEATLVGPLVLAGYDPDYLMLAESIAVSPIDGNLYVCGGPVIWYSNMIMRVNPATGISTLMANITGTYENDADSTVFINETLYMTDTCHTAWPPCDLYTVDINSGATTRIGDVSVAPYWAEVGIGAYNPETQKLIGVDGQRSCLFEISPSTAEPTLIAFVNVGDFEGLPLNTIGLAYDIEVFTASISPVSSSIMVGNSVTFTSTVSGGAAPYSYEWFLDGTLVSSATSDSWTFTPTTSGNYTVQLNVTDNLANIAVSNIANVTVDEGVHDVAVTNVETSKHDCVPMPTVGQNHIAAVNVTVANFGTFDEGTVTVTVYATQSMPLSIVIGSATVSLNVGQNMTLAFTWNSTGFAYGYYTISATVDPVAGETNTGDNAFTGDTVLVTIPGDINGDGIVDIYDAILLANAFNSTPEKPNWNTNADINGDNIVDIYDAILLANHFNQHYT